MSHTAVPLSTCCVSGIEPKHEDINRAEHYHPGMLLICIGEIKLTNEYLASEQPFAASAIFDEHLSTRHQVHPAFIPSITLPSLLEAQVASLPSKPSTVEDSNLKDQPLIYGFPAHWFGVNTISASIETSGDGDRLSNPTITISSPEPCSPKPTYFGIDSSWMSCCDASTSPGLRHSATSSWLDDDSNDFPRPLDAAVKSRELR